MLIHTQDSSKQDIYFVPGMIKKFDMERTKLSEFLNDEIYQNMKDNWYEVYMIKDQISKYYISERSSLWYNKETKDIKYIEVKKNIDWTIKRYILEEYDTFDSDLTFFERMILEDFYFDKDWKSLDRYPEWIWRLHLELNSSWVSKEYFEENKYKFWFTDHTTGERLKKD